MKLILVHSKESIAKTFSLEIESEIDFEILIYSNLEQARGMADILPDIKSIILLETVPDKEFERFLKKLDNTKVKVLAPQGQACANGCTLWNSHEDILTSLSTSKVKKEKKDYIKFPVSHLSVLDVAPVDYYLMLGDKRKFLKVINSGDNTFKKALLNLNAKKITEVYVKSEEVELMLSTVKKLLDKIGGEKLSHFEIQQEVFALLKGIGLSQEALDIANESISNLKTKLEGNVDTKDLLNKVYTSSTNKSYQLSYMTALMISSVGKNLDWFDSKIHEASLNATLFNDMLLSDDYIFIRNLEDLKHASGTDQLDILEHAINTAKSLENSKIPNLETTLNIITQHHGSKTGQGFGVDLTPISKPASLFIICEEFSAQIVNAKNGKVNVPAILKNISQTYKGKSVNLYCQSILKVFKDA